MFLCAIRDGLKATQLQTCGIMRCTRHTTHSGCGHFRINVGHHKNHKSQTYQRTNLCMQQLDEIAQARYNLRAQVAIELSFRCFAGAARDQTWIAAVGECDTLRHTAVPPSQQRRGADLRQTGQRLVESFSGQPSRDQGRLK